MEGYSRVEHAPQIRVRGDDLKKKNWAKKKRLRMQPFKLCFSLIFYILFKMLYVTLFYSLDPFVRHISVK